MTHHNETAGDMIGSALDVIARDLRSVTVSVRSAGRRGSSRRERGGEGAGIIWSADGTLVTNAHVAVADTAVVTLSDGRTTQARVVARDGRLDLALLRIDTAALNGAPITTAVIGEPASLRAGQVVLALGHPLGVQHALTMGVVHAAPNATRSPYIVADLRLAPGNSGGPLADASGRIVGVNSMIVGGLGVAISVDAVRGLMRATVPHPALGAKLRPVRVPSGARESSVAWLVLSLDPRGAAARAGILQGDVLLGHAGRPFAPGKDLKALLRDAGLGGSLRLDVGRGGRKVSCTVLLDATSENGQRAA
jgi:serine protease Do